MGRGNRFKQGGSAQQGEPDLFLETFCVLGMGHGTDRSGMTLCMLYLGSQGHQKAILAKDIGRAAGQLPARLRLARQWAMCLPRGCETEELA